MVDRQDEVTRLTWLVYVARSTIEPGSMESQIADIVAASCHRNAARGITGALISSETYFAQYIEGPEAAVTALLERIRRDPRQEDLHVIERGERDERQFPRWAMAYNGRSVFVRHFLSDVFAAACQSPATASSRLIALMREFTPLPE